MIQSSNSLEGIPLAWSFRDVFIYLKLDSKNKIFRFTFKAPENQEMAFKALHDIILNQDLDYLCESLVKRSEKVFYDNKSSNLKQWQSYQKSIFQLREALFSLKGEISWTSLVSQMGKNIDARDLICNCIGIQRSDLVEYFRIHKGDKSDFIRMTNATMTCAQCTLSMEKAWSEIEKDASFVEKINLAEFKRKLSLALKDFKSFTHLDLGSRELEIVNLENSVVSVEITNNTSTQDILENSVIENALVNYLNGHLQLKLKVVIVNKL